MTTMLDRLVAQLDGRGLKIVPGDQPGQLRLLGPKAELTPDIVEAVKAFKPLLLERYARLAPDLPTEARPDVITEPPPPGESVPPAATLATEDDRSPYRVLRTGASRPARAETLVGPEHRTHALISVSVTPADLVPWEEVRHLDPRDGKPKDYPPAYRLRLPVLTAWLCGGRFRELFPAAV